MGTNNEIDTLGKIVNFYLDLDTCKKISPDNPSVRITPIWEKYLRSGCVSSMTKKEALQQGMYFSGDLTAMVADVATARVLIAAMLMEQGKTADEAVKQAKQQYPYEFLFVYAY